MADITREQFAEAVSAAMKTVKHLQRELAKLYESLRDELGTGAEPLRELISPTGLRVRVRGDNKRPGLSAEYSSLFVSRESADVESETDSDTYDESEGSDSKAVVLVATRPVLAMRIVLTDDSDTDSFEPQILYAILDDWGVGESDKKPQTDDVLQLRRYMTRRIPQVLNAGDEPPKRLRTTAAVIGRRKGDRRLTCNLRTPVASVPIFELDGLAAVEQFAADVKAVWTRASANT